MTESHSLTNVCQALWLLGALWLCGCGDGPVPKENAELKKRLERLEQQLASQESVAPRKTIETIQPVLEAFEASDATGHLVSRGFRQRLPDGNYVRAGHWTFFHSDGRKQMEGQFENDVRVGRWTFYLRDEEAIDYQEDFELGAAVFRIVYHGKPNVKSGESRLRNGMPVGEGTAYREDGSREAVQVCDEQGVLLSWRMYRRDGREFAAFEADQFTIDGVLQPKVTRKYDEVTKDWDSPVSVAWTLAIKQLRMQERP